MERSQAELIALKLTKSLIENPNYKFVETSFPNVQAEQVVNLAKSLADKLASDFDDIDVNLL